MKRTAKSAKRMLALTLLSALAVTGASGVAIFSAAGKAPFSLTATPSSQTVTAGQPASYVIGVQRDNKFTGSVTLSVSGLPSSTRTTTSFGPNPVPGSTKNSTLTVNTDVGGTTPAGTYPLTITGTSGSSSTSVNATLVVISQTAPNFALSATPTSRIVSEDDSAGYALSISRSGGFTGAVTFTASGLPKDVTAQFSPSSATADSSTLVLTSNKPKPGNYAITITGTGQAGATQLTRSTAVNLTVEEKKPFQISGDPSQQLSPGSPAPLDLTLTNPQNFPLQVNEIAVSVDDHTSAPGCSGHDNYSVDQIPLARYPITLPANSTQTLSALDVADDDRPMLVMNDLLTADQDACKGAQVFLHYSGAATR